MTVNATSSKAQAAGHGFSASEVVRFLNQTSFGAASETVAAVQADADGRRRGIPRHDAQAGVASTEFDSNCYQPDGCSGWVSYIDDPGTRLGALYWMNTQKVNDHWSSLDCNETTTTAELAARLSQTCR